MTKATSERRPYFRGGNPIATPERGARPQVPHPCQAREVLDRVGDKWSLYVVHLLGEGTKRFSELQRHIDGITPRMLTVTLRSLERDGLVTRTVYPVIPPRVDYELTPVGRTLLDAVSPLVQWAQLHLADIERARTVYDRDVAPAVPLAAP